MRKNRFSFYNLHTSKLLLYFIPSLALSIFIALFSGVYWWLCPSFVVIVFSLILIVSKGHVTVSESRLLKIVSIKTIKKEYILKSPLVWDSFWTYDFIDKSKKVKSMRGRRNKSNDILVIFQIKEESGKGVLFLERNVFGIKFPDNIRYSKDDFKTDLPIIKIQSVDKLMSFFLKILDNRSFYSEVKVPKEFIS